jgi:phosphomevalonate kinase
VEIEPACFTEILDRILKIENVFYVIVPGAGGYDAICILCLGDSSSSLDTVLQNTKHKLIDVNLIYADDNSGTDIAMI